MDSYVEPGLLLLDSWGRWLGGGHGCVDPCVLFVRVLDNQHPLAPCVNVSLHPVLPDEILDDGGVAGLVEELKEVGFRPMIVLATCAEPDIRAAGDCCGADARANRQSVDAEAPVSGDEGSDVSVIGENVGGGGSSCCVVDGSGWMWQERSAEEENWGGGKKYYCLFVGALERKKEREGDGLVLRWAVDVVYISPHPFEGRVTVRSRWRGYLW